MILVRYIDDAINTGNRNISVPASLLSATSLDGIDAANKICKLNKVEIVIVDNL